MSKIIYADKVALNTNAGIPAQNKVNDTDMNNIKNSINQIGAYVTASVQTGQPGKCYITAPGTLASGDAFRALLPSAVNPSANAQFSVDGGTTYYPIYYAGVQIIVSDCAGKYVTMYFNGTNFEIVDKIKPIYALVTISANQTLASNYVIQLNQIASQFGGKFTLSSGAVVVGSGVKKIKASAGVFGQGLTTGNYLWAYIRKNGNNQGGNILSSAGSYCSSSVPPTIFDVAQGDLITLMGDSPSGGTTRAGQANTWLLLEVVE